MTNFITEALLYVVNDGYFWPAMAFTSMIGIFIGATLYNGDMLSAKKSMVSILAYAMLIVLTISTRVIPQLSYFTPEHMYMPFAGITTVLIVSSFYLLGMGIGVRVTKFVHREVKK